MGFTDRGITNGLNRVSMGSLAALTLNAETQPRIVAPGNFLAATLQAKFLTERVPLAEIWVPVGISYVITTGITVNAALVTLTKNGTIAATGGVASAGVHAADATTEYFAPFTAWTFAAADAVGDAWSVKVTTASTAGVINPVYLWYAVKLLPAVNEGVSI